MHANIDLKTDLKTDLNLQYKKIRKIAFAGTPEFAAEILAFLHQQSDIEIKMVLSMPDQAKGRGMQLMPTPVKAYCLENKLQRPLNISQPTSLNFEKDVDAKKTHTFLKEEVDALIVVAYGMLLPAAFVDEILCLNIHASLLPRWRGAAPIQRAIEAGDRETGIAIMHMDKGLDTGHVLYQQSTPIAQKTAGELNIDLQNIAKTSILHVIQNYAELAKNQQPQIQSLADEAKITYAKKISKDDARLDLSENSQVILQKIRAYHPVPAAYFCYQSQNYKVWQAKILSSDAFLELQKNYKENNNNLKIINKEKIDYLDASSGGLAIYFHSKYLVLKTADAYLQIEEIQAPNKKRMSCEDFLRGFKF